MDILQLIDRLEELFNDAKAVPFTHNVLVDEDRMLEIIDQMRIVIPDEVKKAQQVLAQRERYLAQAQEEADRTIVLARDKAEQIAAKDNIAVEAQRRADQIITQARADADATRADADDYVVDTLMQLAGQPGKGAKPGAQRRAYPAAGSGAQRHAGRFGCPGSSREVDFRKVREHQSAPARGVFLFVMSRPGSRVDRVIPQPRRASRPSSNQGGPGP